MKRALFFACSLVASGPISDGAEGTYEFTFEIRVAKAVTLMLRRRRLRSCHILEKKRPSYQLANKERKAVSLCLRAIF